MLSHFVNPIFKVAVDDQLPKPLPKTTMLVDPVLARFCLVGKLNRTESNEIAELIDPVLSPAVRLIRRVPRAPYVFLHINDELDSHREDSAEESPILGFREIWKDPNPPTISVMGLFVRAGAFASLSVLILGISYETDEDNDALRIPNEMETRREP